MIINLKIELEDLNKVLEVLTKEPYKEVASLINNIKGQGDEQFNEANK